MMFPWCHSTTKRLLREVSHAGYHVTVALRSVLRAGREAAYDVAHERIPTELIEAHRRVGIRDWRIWRNGRDLFHLVECDDLEAAMRELEHDPANERRQAFIGDFVEHFEAAPLRLVWCMRDQLANEDPSRPTGD